MTSETFTQSLQCELTDAEVRLYATLQAERVRDLAAVQSAKKLSTAQFGAREQTINAEILRLSRAIIAGAEEREIECEVRMDFRNAVAETIRLDLCTVVDRRPLTAREMQRRFDLDGVEDRDAAELHERGRR